MSFERSIEVSLGVFVEPEVISHFPRTLAEEFSVVPLRKLGKGLLVGTEGQLSSQRVTQLTARLGVPVAVIPCRIGDSTRVLDLLYSGDETGRRIGEVLTDQDLISREELDHALEKQRTDPKPLGKVLLELGLISQQELSRSLEQQQKHNNRAMGPMFTIDPKLKSILPESLARKYRILPLTLEGDELAIASVNHLDDSQTAELNSFTGHTVLPILVEEADLEAALEKTYGQPLALNFKHLKLGEILVSEGLITVEQLKKTLAEQKNNKGKLGEILVRNGLVSEEAVFSAVAKKINCEFKHFSTSEIDLELSHYLPRRFAEQNKVLMLYVVENSQEIVVAMADPLDLNQRDIIQGIIAPHGYRIRPVLASPANIDQGIAYTFQSNGLIDSEIEIETVSPDKQGYGREDLSSTHNLPETNQMINQMLYSAVVEGASDIHIENLENEVKIRFRIDGVLENRSTPINKSKIRSVITVLKVDSGLDIAERRRSQDGVFKKRIGRGRFIDFRINVHATPFGEDAVIRILDRDKNLLPLESLGFEQDMLSAYQSLVENPQGLILFTGPTGSGKTTTLYSTLTHLNRGNKKIVTAEDPIEYTLRGISQYQVNEAIGNTFDDYARRFLRKDPDIILIGEIRDNKTARACVTAAMTGHLVFSTLHTNDSVGVVQRMFNLDIPSASVADSILLVVSQRLARRVCAQCREPYEPDEKLIQEFFPSGRPADFTFVHGRGCESCRFKGYRGRVGLYEFWEVGSHTKNAIAHNESEEELRELAVEDGLKVLLYDGLEKVKRQTTTLEELSRVVAIEQIRRYADHIDFSVKS